MCVCVLKLQQLGEQILEKKSSDLKLESNEHLLVCLNTTKRWLNSKTVTGGPTAEGHKSPLRWVTAARGRSGVLDAGLACENSRDNYAIARGKYPTTQRNSPTEDFLTFSATWHEPEFVREENSFCAQVWYLLKKSPKTDFITSEWLSSFQKTADSNVSTVPVQTTRIRTTNININMVLHSKRGFVDWRRHNEGSSTTTKHECYFLHLYTFTFNIGNNTWCTVIGYCAFHNKGTSTTTNTIRKQFPS